MLHHTFKAFQCHYWLCVTQVWRKADSPARLIPLLSITLQWGPQLCFNQFPAPIRLNDSIFCCHFKDELQWQQPLQAIGNSFRPLLGMDGAFTAGEAEYL